jgi:hypothetical protein
MTSICLRSGRRTDRFDKAWARPVSGQAAVRIRRRAEVPISAICSPLLNARFGSQQAFARPAERQSSKS